MGNACSASKKKFSSPLKPQDVQSPKPPPTLKGNNMVNLTPTKNPPQPINENVPKNAEIPPESEVPQKPAVEQRRSISNQKNSLLQNEIISPNNEPLPPPSLQGMGEEHQGQVCQEDNMDGEKNGENEIHEEPRQLEEMNFNYEGEEEGERGEEVEEGEGEREGEDIFQNDNYENQYQSEQDYNEMFGGGYNEDEGDEEEYYNELRESSPKMKNASKSTAGPVLMALKAENVNDFFAAPAVKEEGNEVEANNEFKNANNETEDHENNLPEEEENENEQARQVKYKF